MIELLLFSLRNGEWNDFLAAELVPGDIIFCDVGDRVPADIRLFEVKMILGLICIKVLGITLGQSIT